MTPFTIDIAELVSPCGRYEVQLRIEDEGAPSDGLVIFDGCPEAWECLSAVPSDADDHLLAYLSRAPAVLVGRVRGECAGYAAELVARLDVVWGTKNEAGVTLEHLCEAVRQTPGASVVTASLLRGQNDLTVAQALLRESEAYSLLQSGREFAAWRATQA